MSTENPLDFLSGEPTPAPTPEPAPASGPAASAPAPEAQAATPAPEPEAAPGGPQRDDKGRFAPKGQDGAPAPQPAPAPVAAAPAPAPAATPAYTPPTPEEWAALQKENQGLKSAVTANRTKAREARQPATPPAYWTEEDKAHHEREVEAVRLEVEQAAFDRVSQASFSRFAKSNGEDLAKQVAAWAGRQSQLDPSFNSALLESNDPLETAYEAFQQDPVQLVKALQAKIAALEGGSAPNPANPANPTPAAPASPPAPRTIANAPSSGGAAHVPTGPGQAFAALPI